MIRLTSRFLLICVLSLGTASLSQAQTTGPIGSTSQETTANFGPSPQPLNEASLLEAIRGTGAEPCEQKGPKGSYWTFQLQRDGWRYQLEVHVAKDINQTITGYYLVCPMSQMSGNPSSAQLLKILQSNLNTAPCFISHRIADNRLVMMLQNPASSTDPIAFQRNVSLLLSNVRNTFAVWNMTMQLAQN